MAVDIKIQGLTDVVATIDRTLTVLQKQEINMKRARAFKEFTIERVENDALGLTAISPATARLSEVGDHPPLWETGEMISSMEVKKKNKNTSEAGYFAGVDPRSGKKWSELVALHQGGYTIKVTKNMRGFLWFKGVLVGTHMKVPPRPFLIKAAQQYVESQEDAQIIKEFMDKL